MRIRSCLCFGGAASPLQFVVALQLLSFALLHCSEMLELERCVRLISDCACG